MSKHEPAIRSVAKWLLIVILAILAAVVLSFAFEFVRLLIDPGHRA
jgi:FlaG/FlaF family flagellin (archaellin)